MGLRGWSCLWEFLRRYRGGFRRFLPSDAEVRVRAPGGPSCPPRQGSRHILSVGVFSRRDYARETTRTERRYHQRREYPQGDCAASRRGSREPRSENAISAAATRDRMGTPLAQEHAYVASIGGFRWGYALARHVPRLRSRSVRRDVGGGVGWRRARRTAREEHEHRGEVLGALHRRDHTSPGSKGGARTQGLPRNLRDLLDSDRTPGARPPGEQRPDHPLVRAL